LPWRVKHFQIPCACAHVRSLALGECGELEQTKEKREHLSRRVIYTLRAPADPMRQVGVDDGI
jgi:hypothetical protein